MPRLSSPRFLTLFLLVLALAVGGALALTVGNDFDRHKHRSASRLVGSNLPTLTSGFVDWALCSLEHRVESHPSFFQSIHFGPGEIGGASGCGPCGGSNTFSGNPFTAGLGLVLAPPNDMESDVGELPPDGHDHPNVLAGTGEVVYTETDFILSGRGGFDFRWERTYRSAMEYSGELGYGWDCAGFLYLVQNTTTGNVRAYLGNGRVNDQYLYVSGTGGFTSPEGFFDKLEKLTRAGGAPYFKKTERIGVVWEFDRLYSGAKDIYGCTKITDGYGNDITFAYASSGDPTILEKITDTEGREVTFTRSNGRITQVVVSSSSIDAAYGNVTIDYEYAAGTDRLSKVTKHKTKLKDSDTTTSRPYTEYTYYTSGSRVDNLDLVKDCGTTVLDFDYPSSGADFCTQVEDGDGATDTYLYSQTGGGETWTQYTDVYGQRQDFVYTTGADRTIAKRKDYLEDKNGADITNPAVTTYTRGCGCGQITQIEYPDGSKEKWTYETDSTKAWGAVLQYERHSSNGADPALVKKWTYDTFANKGRRLTSTGWLQATSTPSTQIAWTWTSSGLLDYVDWPAVSTGQPASQSIRFDYNFNADGTLDYAVQPNGDKSRWTYSGDDITRTDDPDTGGLARAWKTYRNKHGAVIKTEDPTGTASAVTYTVTPLGWILKVAGANGQETKQEFTLRGQLAKVDRLLEDSPLTRTVTTNTYSAAGELIQSKSDDGGLNASTDYASDLTNRWRKVMDPDKYGDKIYTGYGSYNLHWKRYRRDENASPATEAIALLEERDTMGRVTAEEEEGWRTEYGYDGYGRLKTTTTLLPNSQTRVTTLTLKPWGAVEKEEVKVGSTVLAITNYHYDEANRLWKMVQEDPEDLLADRTIQYERDKNGRVAKHKDPLLNVWETQWDKVGRVSKSIEPAVGGGANEVQFAYDDANRTRTITSKEYDAVAQAYANYKVVETMDASGRMTSSKDEGSASGNRTTTYTWDEGNRRTKTTSPLGSEIVLTYDALDRVVSERKDIDASTAAITSMTVSLGGRLNSLMDANGVVTAWTYDAFGRNLTTTYRKSATETNVYTRSYESHGWLKTVTDPMGAELEISYDDGGRIYQVDIHKNSSGLKGPDRLVFERDLRDNVTSGKTLKNNSSTYVDLVTVTRSYNGFGQMKQEAQHGSRTFDFTYHDDGSLKEITFPTGGPVVALRYTKDAAGRLEKVERKLSTAVDGITSSNWQDAGVFKYAGWREVMRTQSPYDLRRTQSWTSFLEPANLEYRKDSTNVLKTGLGYYWDADRRMVARSRLHDQGADQRGEVYRYDEMNRLLKFWRNVTNPQNYASTDPGMNSVYDDRVEHILGKVYERDKVNVTPAGGSTEETNYSNNDSYQYTIVDPPGSTSISPQWDADGHCIDYDTWSYDWTALNQLAKATPDSGMAREYTYDAFGRRVETKVGSAVSKYIYVGWHMVGEHDGTCWLWQEVPLPGEDMLEHLAKDTNDLDNDNNTTEIRQYAVHTDFQATVWGLTDVNASIVERYRYRDPYGDTYTEDPAGTGIGDYASNVHCQKRLHGGVVDTSTKLYDFRHRWVNATTGAWLCRDPLGVAASPNVYQAWIAEPLVLTDPYGLQHGKKTPPGFDADLAKSLNNILDHVGSELAGEFMMSILREDIVFQTALLFGTIQALNLCSSSCCPDSSKCADSMPPQGDYGSRLALSPALRNELGPHLKQPKLRKLYKDKRWQQKAKDLGLELTAYLNTPLGGYAYTEAVDAAKQVCEALVARCRTKRKCESWELGNAGRDKDCNRIEPEGPRKDPPIGDPSPH